MHVFANSILIYKLHVPSQCIMYSRDNTKDEFLNQLKVDREKRRVERLKNESIITIQVNLICNKICY